MSQLLPPTSLIFKVSVELSFISVLDVTSLVPEINC